MSFQVVCALRQWEEFLEVKRAARRAAGRILHRDLGRAMERWLEVAAEAAQRKQRMQNAFGRLGNPMLTSFSLTSVKASMASEI